MYTKFFIIINKIANTVVLLKNNEMHMSTAMLPDLYKLFIV